MWDRLFGKGWAKAAAAYIDKYFQRYPGVKQYMDDTKAAAKSMGYVETVFGRRLYLPEINSPNGPRRAGAERAAINAPIQGTAADIMKIAMIRIDHALNAGNYQARMTLQVHDELVFDVPPNEVDEIKALVEREMEGAYTLTVPLRVDVGSGPNWDEVK